MSGEDDRGEPKPGEDGGRAATGGKNPFLDDAGRGPVPRRRRVKPPPNIITAGGVDMARGHAVGVIRRDPGPEPIVDEPRVVLAVETDLRKIPTHKRLLEGRDPAADGSRAALLPTGAASADRTPPTGAARPEPPAAKAAPGARVEKAAPGPRTAKPAPGPGSEPQRLPGWMRLGFAVGLLLLAAVGITTGLHAPPPRATAVPLDEPVAPLPALPAPTLLVESPPEPAPSVSQPSEGPIAAEPSGGAAPRAAAGGQPRDLGKVTASRPARAAAHATPPPPRPAFTPPFQLPSEKH